MPKDRYKVIKNYESPYPNSVIFNKGEKIKEEKNLKEILIGRTGFGVKEKMRRMLNNSFHQLTICCCYGIFC
jgi:hypothetical protein